MSRRENVYAYESAARQLEKNNDYVVAVPRRPGAKQKTVQFRLSYGIMFIVVATLLVSSAMKYISLQSDVTMLLREKGHLMAEVEDAKASNDLYYESIVSGVDLKEVERIAVEELGMKMAGEGQILTYSGDVEDYVKQYGDIPR